MTPDQQFILALAAQFAALVTGVIALWVKVDGVHHEMNSMKDQLVATTRQAAHAQGVLEGAASSPSGAVDILPPMPIADAKSPMVPLRRAEPPNPPQRL